MIHKQQPSSFTGTDLNEHLKKLGKNKIVLAGMCFHPAFLGILSCILYERLMCCRIHGTPFRASSAPGPS